MDRQIDDIRVRALEKRLQEKFSYQVATKPLFRQLQMAVAPGQPGGEPPVVRPVFQTSAERYRRPLGKKRNGPIQNIPMLGLHFTSRSTQSPAISSPSS